MSNINSIREYLDLKLEEKRRSISDALARGVAKDYAEYRQLSGLIQGLEFAQNLVADLAQRLTEDADD